MDPTPALSADAALRQLRGAVAQCLHEADHLPEGQLLSQRWSIDAYDALRRFDALDELIGQGHLPADWSAHQPSLQTPPTTTKLSAAPDFTGEPQETQP